MRTITLRQHDPIRTIEIDAAVVHEVGILLRINADGLEPNLTLFPVHAVYPAHEPFTLSNGILDLTGGCVIEIEMIPAAPFRHPDQFVAVA